MLARTYRLRRSKDIVKVYQRGRYAGGHDFVVKAHKSNWPNSRLAIVVSRKISKSAVIRNRIRRRLSGLVEELWQTVRPGYDIVISVRSDISALPADKLRESLSEQLRRLGIIE